MTKKSSEDSQKNFYQEETSTRSKSEDIIREKYIEVSFSPPTVTVPADEGPIYSDDKKKDFLDFDVDPSLLRTKPERSES